MKAHENILLFYRKLPTYNPQKTEGLPYNRGVRDKKHGVQEVMNEIPNYNTHIIKSVDGRRFPRSVQKFTTAEFEGKFHPTQKPVALFEYLIKTYTNEGDLVLDNCAGSGTTAIACMNTNRNYILMEKEQKYYDIILDRIKMHSLQTIMF